MGRSLLLNPDRADVSDVGIRQTYYRYSYKVKLHM